MRFASALNFDFYHRLTRREQVLLLAVVGTVFVLVNLFALRLLLTNFKELSRQYSEKSAAVTVAGLFTQDKPKWSQWDKWVQSNQPKLVNRDSEWVKLQNQIKSVGDRNGVILSGQQIILQSPNGDAHPGDYQALYVKIDAKGDWTPMFKFIKELQQPETFIVFDSARLHTESDDPKTTRGEFRIAKWYAPTEK